MRLFIPVNSSVIEQITFDTYTRILAVVINGSEYSCMSSITFEQFRSFMKSESKGKFYNRYVKGRW